MKSRLLLLPTLFLVSLFPFAARAGSVAPSEGDVLMWESWLRHEVTPNGAEEPRVSVSFNYRWERE